MATVFRDINNKQNQALVTDSSVTKWKLNKMGKTSQMDPNCLQSSDEQPLQSQEYKLQQVNEPLAYSRHQLLCPPLLHVCLLARSHVMALHNLRETNQKHIKPWLTTKA